jgi:GntR family transcriptional regulator
MAILIQRYDDVFQALIVHSRPSQLRERAVPSNKLRHRPIYLQVCDVLTERIARGEWKPGRSIPNEIDMARDLGVSSGTVRKALDLLESNHVLTRRQGHGTFVTDPATNGMADRFYAIRGPDGAIRTGAIEVAEIAQGTASETESARLHLEENEPVWRLKRIRRDRQHAFMCERVALPANLFPEMHAHEPNRIVALARRYGIMLGTATERIHLGAASPEAAATLAVEPGTPVLVLDRVVHTRDGRPVEWRHAECHVGAGHYLAPLAGRSPQAA